MVNLDECFTCGSESDMMLAIEQRIYCFACLTNETRIDINKKLHITWDYGHSDYRNSQYEHELKCWPRYFQLIWAGFKTLEIRLNDRGFRYGDRLILREYDPRNDTYTDRKIQAMVTDVLDQYQGLAPGHVAMSINFLHCFKGDDLIHSYSYQRKYV